MTCFLRLQMMRRLRFRKKWTEWECLSSEPSHDCQVVQKGTFAWEGEYRLRLPSAPQGMLSFKLSGRSGKEEVKVTINGVEKTFKVPKSGKWFDEVFPSSGKYSIQFLNDKGNENDVFFLSSNGEDIELPARWNDWKCTSSNENEISDHCAAVKKGRLNWKGEYVLMLPGH